MSARIETVSGSNFTAAQIGPFDGLDRYELRVEKLDRTIKGKVFLKRPLALTGMELSLNKVRGGARVPFLHRHEAHEELYVFLSGRGEFQVDGRVIPIEPGTVVRIATGGARAYRSTSEEPLTFICIQAKEGSMTDAETITDGRPVEGPVVWPSQESG
jgi:mannose-6-phosphate isomerase-like protein (cupin superfamily)